MPPPFYSATIAALIDSPHPVSLGVGKPNDVVGDQLRRLDSASLFDPLTVCNEHMAQACFAGLWLRFDFLVESHSISQANPTAEGSYWHGILHRREGDYGNAKYWFRQVGHHPVYARLGVEAQRIAGFPSIEWDPLLFVDRVENCLANRLGDSDDLKAIQAMEWQILFDYCYVHAIRE